MRAAIVMLALAVSACASEGGIEAWKKTERAKCAAMSDLIQRAQCQETVNTVAVERTRQDEDKKGR